MMKQEDHRQLLMRMAAFLEISYDERGNIVKLKDVSGSVTTYGYDALNRVTETVDANSNVTRYTYDAANRITAVTDASRKSEGIYL